MLLQWSADFVLGGRGHGGSKKASVGPAAPSGAATVVTGQCSLSSAPQAINTLADKYGELGKTVHVTYDSDFLFDSFPPAKLDRGFWGRG